MWQKNYSTICGLFALYLSSSFHQKKKKKRRLIFVVVVLLSQGRKLKSTEKFLLQASVLKAETLLDFPDSSAGKESTCNAEDPGSIPGWGRQPGEGTHSSVLGLPLWLSW